MKQIKQKQIKLNKIKQLKSFILALEKVKKICEML